MVFAAILAGGVGKRMNMANGMPKQFLMLGDKPIILHTIEKFLIISKIDYVFVGVHEDWITYMQDIVDKNIAEGKERVKIVCGGQDRNGTIMNIIKAIKKDFGEDDDNIIITHDAVRPFVTMRMIEENIEMALKYDACDTVIPATDTIVVSIDGSEISEIPNRKTLYQGQTPQSFKINLLEKLYNELSEEEKEILTDACKICIVRNVPVKLVKGDSLNIKITTIGDYKIAQALLKEEE